MKYTKIKITVSFLLFLILGMPVHALRVGDIVRNVKIRDTRDLPAYLPDFGRKVLIVFYNDADVADQNDHIAQTLQKSHFPREYYRPMGIGNLKDAPWKPNAIIRLIARRKEKKYNVTVLTDPSYILKDAWGLGDCNDKSVFIIINIEGKILYIFHGKIPEKEKENILKIIKKEISYLKNKGR